MGNIKKNSFGLITIILGISFAASDVFQIVPRYRLKAFGCLHEHNHKPWAQKYPCHNGRKYTKPCCPDAPEVVNNYQCPTRSFPPIPESGCCGRQMSDTDMPILHSTQNPPTYGDLFQKRFKRAAIKIPLDTSVDKRIVGGRSTELHEYPWTVFVRKTFDYGVAKKYYQCGGSLISSRYVLTAAHCVHDEKGKRHSTKLEVFLAEYDIHSYPKDCKIVFGRGKMCIDNVVIIGENAIIHPEYDDTSLKNDIALIKLTKDAPYTNYIRPICLPITNINSRDSHNINMAVTGWGHNGSHTSNIKETTVVSLVPNSECQKIYPNLSPGQMCAVGRNGQDSCKGDSGGPLMMMNNGKFELVGLVSGQAPNSTCGTRPALYTNVSHYLSWIYLNVRD